MATKLITPGEVITAAPESSKFPAALLEPHIQRKEDTLSRTCLGRTFYDLLLADVVDYGTLSIWKASGTYAEDEYVDYYGLILKSKVADNSTNPCDDDGTNWEVAAKFGTACYESLWTLYLKPYLAFTVMASALDYATFPAGAKGVVEWVDDQTGAKSASMAVLNARKSKLLSDAAEVMDNMKDWMIRETQDTTSTCDFSDVPFVSNECGPACAPRHLKRRFAFNDITKTNRYYRGYYR